MPISEASINVTGFKGYLWTIEDEEALARLVARVYLGHARHVEKILRELNPEDNKLAPSGGAVRSAQERLRGRAVEHRDGLLFQTISWIVAQKNAPVGSVIRIPHLIPAHKGFDGLQIDIARPEELTALIVFEDKATTKSRVTIRQEVWPSFRELEAGDRENELMQETVALLDRAANVDRDKIVQNIIWDQVRRYRVSITGQQAHRNAERFRKLFKGYETVAPGDRDKRIAAILCINDLRRWMANFAGRVERALGQEEETGV